MTSIYPVILCGGSGTRLWPLSRKLYPKQFLPLLSQWSLLQETVRRIDDPIHYQPPLVLCNEEHRFLVAEQLRSAGVSPGAILLEPEGRNTAPAIAAAAAYVAARDPGAQLLVLPSDHAITDNAAFHGAVGWGLAAASKGKLVTFSIPPRGAATGYGYIRRGTPLEAAPGCFVLEEFVEKPPQEIAEQMLEAGGWDWNAGIFLLPARLYLEELRRLQPKIAEAGLKAIEDGSQDLDFLRLSPAFLDSPSLSIDYAVMEHTPHAVTVPVEMGWNDIGSWEALWSLHQGEADHSGNVLRGPVETQQVHNSYLHSEGVLVAALGVSDLVVVATKDAVLISHRNESQRLGPLVADLEKAGHEEAIAPPRVYRPWGSFESIDSGPRFQVKEISVRPGGSLSLQRHRQRAEHWIVVNGTARVTRGEDILTLGENESVYIPAGTIHRLENPGETPLILIEVQSGDYLGEDDIERLEDIYGR